MIEKLEKKNISFTKRQIEMIEEIRKAEGFLSFTSVIHTALSTYYRKIFPNYTLKYNLGKISDKQNRTLEDVVKHKIEEKQLKEKIIQENKEAKKIDICVNVLRGKVEEDNEGFKYCKFEIHDKEKSYEQVMPLMQADPSMERTLFTPNKEIVYAFRPELKKKYGK